MASSVTIAGSLLTFIGESGTEAVARRTVTTTEIDDAVSFTFEIERRPLLMRIGTTAGGQEVVPDVEFAPGTHFVTVSPNAATYYVEFRFQGIGRAILKNFAAVTNTTFSLTSPWAIADLDRLRYDQVGNVMWLYHPNYPTYTFERRGANSWSFRKFEPDNGPFKPLNLSSVTLTPSGRTGTVQIDASQPIFSEADNGMLLRLTHAGQYETESLDQVDAITEPIKVQGVEASRTFYYSITGTFSGTIVLERSIGNELSYQTFQTFTTATSGSINDELDNQIIFYRFRMSAYTSGAATADLTYSAGVTDGIGRVFAVDLDNQVSVEVIEPFAKTEATSLWNFGDWSEAHGYPAAGVNFDGRHWLFRGNEYWASKSDDYENFEIGPLADDALSRTFPGRSASVRWAKAGRGLLAGLSGKEASIMSNNLEEVIIPANVQSRVYTNRGSRDADAIVVDDSAVFISRSGERLYRFGYTSDVGGLDVMDLTRMHRAIGGVGGFESVVLQHEPEMRIHGLRADGQIASLVYSREEQVMAWYRTVVDGQVKRLCVLPDTPEDDIYMVVSRTINGAPKVFLERLATERYSTLTGAWRLDAALAYSGSPTTTLSGLSHLTGESEVYVWGDGREFGPFDLSSGSSITLPSAVSYAIIGLRYAGKYQSPRLNFGAQSGTALTQFKKVDQLGIILQDTPGGALEWGRDFVTMDVLPDIRDSSLFDSPLASFTDDVSYPLEGATIRDARVCIRMPSAGPAKVLTMVPRVTTSN